MTIRGVFGGDVQHIQEQIAAPLRRCLERRATRLTWVTPVVSSEAFVPLGQALAGRMDPGLVSSVSIEWAHRLM
jgi:hypothetical protein